MSNRHRITVTEMKSDPRTLDRRALLRRGVGLMGSMIAGPALVGCGDPTDSSAVQTAATPAPVSPVDRVTLANTGIKTSRLSVGTGTMGGREQRDLGMKGLVKLFRYGIDRGVCWWDTASSYHTHPHIKATLDEIQRDQVVITTKTRKRDPEGIRADIEKFRKEMDTDYVDIVLLHCLTDADWRDKMQGCLDALSEAKEKGWIRAIGCSCHSFEALRATAEEPRIEVNLARLNPYALHMDVPTVEEIPKVEATLALMHQRGKAIYGMKVLGQGDVKDSDRIDKSLRFISSRPYISGYTIGFGKQEQIDDIIQRVERMNITL